MEKKNSHVFSTKDLKALAIKDINFITLKLKCQNKRKKLVPQL
jgi:hypothetical protein